MDQDQTGVNPPESPTEDTTAAANVMLPEDRPAQNIKAEFDRKFGAISQKVDAVLNWIQSQATAPQQQSQPQQTADVSDEELWQASQRGDRQAFEAWTQRQTDRRIAQQMQAVGYAQSVSRQMQAILAKYPVLNDPNHPLTMTANTAFQLLLQQGYPRNQATLLEAAKTAIADRPDIIAELQGGGGASVSRRSAAQHAQAGATGVSHRQDATPIQPRALSNDELALAKRMGVKDPSKSKERFLQRQQEGKSSLGGVAAFIREEEL